MRFIDKTISPVELTEWIRVQTEAKIEVNFGVFQNPEKKALKQYLLDEQKYICCYCEQEVKLDSTIVVEHFLPQSRFKKHELDYYNLHIACTHSNKHCDTVKGDELIVNLLLHPNCAFYFKYSPTGEILPNTHEFKNFAEFKANISNLKFRFQAVVHLISVLDLNNLQLIEERKKTINDLMSVKDTQFDTLAKIEDYLDRETAKTKSSRFPSLIEYLLNHQKTKVEI